MNVVLLFLKEYWPLLTGSGTFSAIAFVAGRKLKVSTEKSAELSNIEKVREIEKGLLDGIREQFSNQVNDLKEHVSEIKKMNDDLQEILKDKDGIIKSLRDHIKNQKRVISGYLKKYGEL